MRASRRARAAPPHALSSITDTTTNAEPVPVIQKHGRGGHWAVVRAASASVTLTDRPCVTDADGDRCPARRLSPKERVTAVPER
eukprot:6062194-Prymnesium_polylepis.2